MGNALTWNPLTNNANVALRIISLRHMHMHHGHLTSCDPASFSFLITPDVSMFIDFSNPQLPTRDSKPSFWTPNLWSGVMEPEPLRRPELPGLECSSRWTYLELSRYKVWIRMSKCGTDRVLSRKQIFNFRPYQKYISCETQIWIRLTFDKILQRTYIYLIFNYALSFWYHYALPFWEHYALPFRYHYAPPFWEHNALTD